MKSGRYMFIIYKIDISHITFMSQDAIYFWIFLIKLVSSCDSIRYKNTVFIRFAGHFLRWKQLHLKETPTQVFSCEISDVFENAYFEEHLRATASEL